MMMPVMSGLDMVRALRKEGVNSKVIFVTGYSEVTFKQILPSNRVHNIISKPFSIEDITTQVKEALADDCEEAKNATGESMAAV